MISSGAFTSFVENMDRSLAFYHDAFGMQVPPLPEAGERPYNPTNAQLFAMFDIPGAKERHQSAQIPNTNVRLELMEVQNVEHRTIPLRVQASISTVSYPTPNRATIASSGRLSTNSAVIRGASTPSAS